ncbi:MAG: hypothetical protein Nk1A_8700 [Endomicrobiia bacterium]|nr:MAG: hypothetical protein Nk1A_8700 [Endomicrobiia bacterium]
MFNFTSTTIINSTQDSSGLTKFYASTNPDDAFTVLRVNKFLTANVKTPDGAGKVYKKLGKEAVKAESQLDLGLPNTTFEGGQYQLKVSIKYLGSQNSFYARLSSYTKGKPLFYAFEIPNGATATEVANKIKQVVQHIEQRFSEKWITVVIPPIVQDGNQLVAVKAIDEYQRFTEVALQKYNPQENVCSCADVCECGWDTIKEAEVKEAGSEGFGTYTALIKDLRLPTAANTYWLAVNQEERPIPGALYNEYIINYVKDRGIMGQSAVGQLATSSTTHVFYVL